MALTPVLLETYRRYKKETNTVVNWLATTASKAGNVTHLLSSTAPQKPGGRLKGKARTAQLPLPSTIKVPVNSFEQLAKNIASANFLVPESILDILKDIIYARQVCATFYESESSEDVEVVAKNARHKYFIRVLENVQRTLKSKSGPKTAGVPRPKTHEQEHHVEEQLSNIFEHLEVEDCLDSESPDDHESASAPNQPVYELETSEDTFLDEAFAIYCFLKDMTDIRLFVHSAWRDYREQKVALTTAASTMNAAIEIFRRVSRAFLRDFPKFSDYGKIVEFLHHAKGKASTEKEDGCFPDHTGSYLVNDIRLSQQTFACEHTYNRYFERYLFQDLHSTFTTNENRKVLTRDGEDEHIRRLLSFFSESAFGKIPLFFTPKEDLLIQAIARSKANKRASPWMVFAVQTYIDLHRELGSDVGRAYKETRRTAAWFTDVFTEYGKGLRGKPESINQSTLGACVEALKELVDEADYSNDTPQDKMPKWTFRGKHFFLKNHPMLCGLMVVECHRKVHETGFDIAGRHSNIVPFMHLYNAGLQSGFLRAGTSWADLEYLIHKHGEEYIFVGGRPTIQESYARFCLAIGINLKSVRMARSGKSIPLNFTRVPRVLHYISSYLNQVAGWNSNKKIYQRADQDAVALMECLVGDYLNKRIDSSGPRASKVARRSTKNLSPLQTLAIFKDAMKEDEFAFRFDVLTLDTLCAQLSHSIEAIIRVNGGLDVHGENLGASKICFTLIPALAAPHGRRLPLLLRVFHLIQETIDRVGNVSYLCAEAQKGTLSLARHPRLASLLLPANKLFGGPESPEDPGDWYLTDEFNGQKYLPTLHNVKAVHHLGPYEERKDFIERLAAVELTNGDTASMTALSSEFVPPARMELPEPEHLDEYAGFTCAHGGSEEMRKMMLEATSGHFRKVKESELRKDEKI